LLLPLTNKVQNIDREQVWACDPKNCPFLWGPGPYLIHVFLSPKKFTLNIISIGSTVLT